MYRIVLVVDGDDYKQGLKVEPDPTTPKATFSVDEDRPKEHPGGIDD